MHNSKIIAILKTLTPKEFRDFGRFVHSPFFNRLRNVVKLYEVLKKYYPEFSNRNLSEGSIYMKIFPSEKFDYWKMKNLISDLMALAEEYLAYTKYRTDNFNRTKYFLESLHTRHLDKMFENKFNEAGKIIKTDYIEGENDYFRKYQLELLAGNHEFDKRDFSSENRLQIITDNFIKFSLLRILKMYIYMINENVVYRVENKELVLINEIINHIKEFKYHDTPAIRIYFLILMIIMDDEEAEKYYFELKDIKIKYKNNLETDELYNINICIANFCTKKVLLGAKRFLSEYFEAIKDSIFHDPWGNPDIITHFRFMNAVITGIKLGEIKWVESFIRDFQNKLQPEYRDETVGLTTAMLLFANNNYEKALAELTKINFDDCHHKMHLRNLTLQIYFELNHFEPALSIIDSYRHFLTREKSISELYRNYNVNFIKYFNELLKLKIGIKEMSADDLLYDVNKSPEFANKDWILEKLREL
jgi:flagellar biosynthesis regulator FlbT